MNVFLVKFKNLKVEIYYKILKKIIFYRYEKSINFLSGINGQHVRTWGVYYRFSQFFTHWLRLKNVQ